MLTSFFGMRLLLVTALAATVAALGINEKLALAALCSDLQPQWCPDGYANTATYDYCAQLGPFVQCNDDTVTDIILESIPGISKLTGFLPTEIGLLPNLRRFYARDSSISGFIPTEIGNTALYDFNMNDNSLIGSLPTEMGNLDMVAIELKDNQLDGAIPVTIFKDQLQNLNLGHNQFSGSIPTEIGLASNLRFVTLSNNELSGSIPTEIGLVNQLFQLFLSNNDLSGSLPSEIGLITDIRAFTTLNNKLDGQIPTEIGNLDPQEGSFFLIGQNQFTGTIPTEVGLLTGLSQLALYDMPGIVGALPTEIGLMTSCHSLWLYGLSVTGSIPTEINLLSNNLVSLRVQNNLLSGSIPDSTDVFGAGRGADRQEFWFNENYLTGEVPQFGPQVLYDCESTFMTPIELCPNPLVCSGNGQAQSPDTSGLCLDDNNRLQGNLAFSPASNEDCFSEYIIYVASANTNAPISNTPISVIPKTPRLNGQLSKDMTGIDVSGGSHLYLYSHAGVPATTSELTNSPTQISLVLLASCSSQSRSGSPSPSPATSPAGSPVPTVSGQTTDDAKSSSSDNAGVAVAVGFVLAGVAAVIVACVLCQRKKKKAPKSRAKVAPEDYDDDTL